MPRLLKDWFESYLDYTANQMSPTRFHRWVAMSCVLTSLGRRVWLDKGYYTLFPNEYIVLVGGSGECMKSVACGIGANMLQSVEGHTPVFSQKITPEALVGKLSSQKEGKAFIYAPELSVFLTVDAYRNGMITILTDMYDGDIGREGKPWVYTTRARGDEKVKEVCVNMLGGSTTKWLKNPIPPDAVGGGFTSRVIFVFSDKPRSRKGKAYPVITQEQRQLRAKLVHDLAEIHKIAGKVEMSPGMLEKSTKWFEDGAGRDEDDVLTGYYSRRQDHCLKLCMGFAAARRDQALITEKDFDDALKMLEDIEVDLPVVVSSLGVTPGGVNTQEVWTIIRKHHEVPHDRLYQALFLKMSAEDFVKAIDNLQQAKMIEVFTDPRGRVYKRCK